MQAVPALLETQRRFLAALYDDADAGPVESIAGNGLEPAARLRIYRHSCEAIQTGALRTSYPAVLALVGAAFFDQTARGYRHAHPSDSGNLQGFGACFADYLASLPSLVGYSYLPDVARLEWLRQESALADDSKTLSPEPLARQLTHADEPLALALHPSVRLLASRYRVLTIWRYTMEPTPEPLQLDGAGSTDEGDVLVPGPSRRHVTLALNRNGTYLSPARPERRPQAEVEGHAGDGCPRSAALRLRPLRGLRSA